MVFDPHIAERRFGYGRSPVVAPPASAAAMLAALAGPDVMAQRHAIPGFRHVQDALISKQRFNSFVRKTKNDEERAAAQQKSDQITADMRADVAQWLVRDMLRRAQTPDAFRERLVAFWADHFTAVGKAGLLRTAMSAYAQEAVRPHVTGRFEDLLEACVTHPLMLHYLDQNSSAGPNSNAAQKNSKRWGLNENLAREVLELHTLGVNGPYTQADVYEMAKLLTGLARTRDFSFVFRKGLVEPGPETVLGKTYDTGPTIETIRTALRDLARHPATARHIAGKLAAHFVSDSPPVALVDALEATWRAQDGDLMAVYDTLLTHPAAWAPTHRNIRLPAEFMSTAVRGLGVPEDRMLALSTRDIRQIFMHPLRLMGQPWQSPNGPDGWAEVDAAWTTPQGVAARLEWAMNMPARLLGDLPEPAAFMAQMVTGPVPERLRFAVGAAENTPVAVGLVLVSPSVQRR